MTIVSKIDSIGKIHNVEIEIAPSELVKINGKESTLILSLDEKEELSKEANVVIGGEEEKEHVKEEVNNEGNAHEEVMNKEDMEEEVKKEKQAKVNSKNKVDKSRKRGKRKKIAFRAMNEVTANNTIDQELSAKRVTKKDKSMGIIFMCSSKTKKDCYHYKVFGLPSSKRDIVLKIHEGMKLFLFDFDLKLLYGIYKAAGPGGYNIEPKAFKSGFPSQVSGHTLHFNFILIYNVLCIQYIYLTKQLKLAL